jgi:hypothetical protein
MVITFTFWRSWISSYADVILYFRYFCCIFLSICFGFVGILHGDYFHIIFPVFFFLSPLTYPLFSVDFSGRIPVPEQPTDRLSTHLDLRLLWLYSGLWLWHLDRDGDHQDWKLRVMMRTLSNCPLRLEWQGRKINKQGARTHFDSGQTKWYLKSICTWTMMPDENNLIFWNCWLFFFSFYNHWLKFSKCIFWFLMKIMCPV